LEIHHERPSQTRGPRGSCGWAIKAAVYAPEDAIVRQSPINGAWCIYSGQRGGASRLVERPYAVSHLLWSADFYTASLDAAMTLVVDDREYFSMFTLERDLRDGPKWTARLDTHGDECGNGESIICVAATAPLALTALFLRARAAA
jgi:hypothetical protein